MLYDEVMIQSYRGDEIDALDLAEEIMRQVHANSAEEAEKIKRLIEEIAINLKDNASQRYAINDNPETPFVFEKAKFAEHFVSNLSGEHEQFIAAMEEALIQSKRLEAELGDGGYEKAPSAFALLALSQGYTRNGNVFIPMPESASYYVPTAKDISSLSDRICEQEKGLDAAREVQRLSGLYAAATRAIEEAADTKEEAARTVQEIRREFISNVFTVEPSGGQQSADEIQRIMTTKLHIILKEVGRDGIDQIISHSETAGRFLAMTAQNPQKALEDMRKIGKIDYLTKKFQQDRERRKAKAEMEKEAERGRVKKMIEKAKETARHEAKMQANAREADARAEEEAEEKLY